MEAGKLLRMYEKMLEIRRFEEAIADLYYKGLVPSSAHLYIGQEAVAVGVCQALREGDLVITTHRGHAHNIAMGVPMDKVAAEILGRAYGTCGGRGGSMRVSSPEHGVVYACPIVGSNIPIAAGMGWAIRMRGEDRVVACFFGDGAANIGAFHEGLNLASVWKSPVVYVCENNLYALSVRTARVTSVESIAERVAAYNIPGVVVDGNDVVAVYEEAVKAVERARRGGGPTLMECRTYRWLGHHAGDPGTAYRAREEVEEWKARCPIKRVRESLMDMGLSEDVERIEAEVSKRVEEAVEKALNSPYPSPETLMDYVY